MRDKPLITLGISCYNAEESIARAIKSALSQTWENKEIVVVDDCSCDGSREIIEGFVKMHPDEIRFFPNDKNQGFATVLNKMIEKARGRYIAFFDDDDISAPERVSKQYEALSKLGADQLALCYTARNQIFPDGSCHYIPTFATREAACGEKVALQILTGQPFSTERGSGATCSCMAPRKTFQELGGFDTTMRKGEDTDFAIRLSLRGGCFVGLAEPLVEQTITLTSDKRNSVEREYWIMLMKKHKGFLESKGQYSFCLEWIALKFDFMSGSKITFARNFLRLLIVHPIKVFQRVWWALPNLRRNLRHRHWRSSCE